MRALERQNAALRQSKPPIEPSVDLARERETVDLARERETGGVNKEESSDIMEARWFLSPMSFPRHLLTFSTFFYVPANDPGVAFLFHTFVVVDLIDISPRPL